jgi:hypothetical protein
MKREARKFGKASILFLCSVASVGIARADVKIKSRQTASGQTYENTTYIKQKRQRTETMNGQMVTIQQCDLKRNIQIMPPAQSYTITPYDDGNSIAGAAPPSGTARTEGVTKGGLVTSTITTKDTGERKKMFGYEARHIITTIQTESSPDSCSPMNSKMEMDGWYIDASFVLECDSQRVFSNYRPQPKSGCQDKYQTKQIGSGKKGYPVWEKMTMFDEKGAESFSTLNEVVELSQATLDASLFEVPAGYREVKDFSGASFAMSGSSSTGMSNTTAGASGISGVSGIGNDDSGMNANVKSMAASRASQPATELGAKKAGVMRLGLAAVKTGSVGEGLNPNELAAAVQNSLTDYLKSPGIELIQLEAKLPSQIVAEATQKECDFVILANVSHKKGSGGGFGSMFGRMAPAINSVPIHTGNTAGNVAGGVAAQMIVSSASMSANVKSKDELTLDIKLQAPKDSTPAVVKQFKSKAKSNGEDIISPVIEQAAQAILDATGKK